ncbi:hypothetical protein DSO57_1008617 [Entomophthora muscae]|uniref:Uncharacterized protein n=1 Tax=Entomophthora muscae TaxID=34485 RepID=A0ACC2RYB7_9FUNG|nr:hypothetical protein DSO57_1008617 [Entomophthora muscae]
MPPRTFANPPDAKKDQATLDREEKVSLCSPGPCICIMDFEPAQLNAYTQILGREVQGCHSHCRQVAACNVQANACKDPTIGEVL